MDNRIPDSITHPKKRAFLENYTTLLNTRATASAIGVSEPSVYNWLRDDEAFSLAFIDLKKKVDAHRLELYEAELDKRALFGSKNSDILLMFALKSLNPIRYRENVQETRLIGDITVKLAVPAYTNTPIQLITEEPKQLEGNTTGNTEGITDAIK